MISLGKLAHPAFGPAMVVLAVVCATPTLVAARPRSTPTAPVEARMIYLRDCATCHGADARGTDDGPTLEGQGPAGVDFMLSSGRMPLAGPHDTMQRSAPSYDASTIAALDSYVDGLVPGGPPIPVVPASGDIGDGGVVYRQQCAACHQSAGAGGALLGQRSPPLDQATPVQIVEAVRTGPGTMPVFAEQAVSDAEMGGLVQYITALQHPDDPGGEPLWHLGPIAEGGLALAAMGVVLLGLRRIGSLE